MDRPSDKTPISDKVRHVKGATQTRDHHCHWPDCTEQVPPAAWGCRAHWYALPEELRTKIWRAYRPGQETDQRPSERYLEVAREVQAWIANRPHAKQARPRVPADNPRDEVGDFSRPPPKPKPKQLALDGDVDSQIAQLALHYAGRKSTILTWMDLIREEWAERSAIREYVGGQPRRTAELHALQDVVEHFNRLVTERPQAVPG